MNKTELVETIARRTDVSKKDVDAVLGTFFDVAAQVVSKGKETLTIPGWVKIEQTQRSARTGRNPQTGAEIKIPASKGVKITAGATLKAIAKGDKPAPK
jgi:DNA-binding protein HU-beta